MPKQKSHKGTLKRMKVTGGGKVTFRKRGKSHLNSHMRGAKLRQLRRDETLKVGDLRRLERILHMRLTPARKGNFRHQTPNEGVELAAKD